MAYADELMQGEDTQEEAAASAALDSLAACSSKVTESYKEWSTALNKFGKSVDKVGPSAQDDLNGTLTPYGHANLQKFNADLTPLIPLPPPGAPPGTEDDSHMFFSSPESKRAIDDILAMHFARTGQQELAEVFMKASYYCSAIYALLTRPSCAGV